MSKNLTILFSAALAISLAGCAPEDPNASGESLQANRVYGQLVVREGEYYAKADVKPWSGWWWPANDDHIFSGSDSPLGKYDTVRQALTGAPSAAADWEKTHRYDPSAVSWAGLCDAWASASILEPEPKGPRCFQGVTFTVADQKALLTKAYERTEGKIQYGQRYDGDRGSVYEDIRPDQFQTVLWGELFVKHHAFIMDKDPGAPVWNTPVYEAVIKMTYDRNRNVMHAQTTLAGADPWVSSYNDVGTRTVTFPYSYDLEGYLSPDGSFHVTGGYWTGTSADYHPDFLTVPTRGTEHHSANTEVDTGVVAKILAAPEGACH